MAANPLARELGLAVEDPLVIDDVEAYPWDEAADLVVVGLGGAGGLSFADCVFSGRRAARHAARANR